METKSLSFEGTVKTPYVDFNHHSGELMLRGRSFPENAASVYEPLLTWIADYVKSPALATNFHLNLEYFNSSSLLWIAKIIKMLSEIDQKDSLLYIHTYFDIDDFDYHDPEELKDLICSMLNNNGERKVSIVVKSHVTGGDGDSEKESTVFI